MNESRREKIIKEIARAQEIRDGIYNMAMNDLSAVDDYDEEIAILKEELEKITK